MPFVPDTSTPASVWSERIVSGLVIVRAPNPPGSSTLISPAAAVFEIAPAKVLHGAVRLHGLASSPTPDTHVRVACACASEAKDTQTANTTKALKASLLSFILFLLTTFPEQRMYRSRKVLKKTKSLRKRRRQMSWVWDSCDYLGNQASILRKFLAKNQ